MNISNHRRPGIWCIGAILTVLSLYVPSLQAADRFWATETGGAFADPVNWLNSQSPTSSDSAVFDVGSIAGYVVDFSADAITEQLHVGNDRVTFDLQGNGYRILPADYSTAERDGPPTDHWIYFGENAGDNADVTILDGLVAGRYGSVASSAGASAALTLDNDAALTFNYYDDGLLSISEAGSATILIKNGSLHTVNGFLAAGATGIADVVVGGYGESALMSADERWTLGGPGGGAASVTVNTDGRLIGQFNVYTGSQIILNGGSVEAYGTDGFDAAPGTLQWNSGTLSLGAGVATVGSNSYLGQSLVLNANRQLGVAGTLSIDAGASVTLDGGVLSVGHMINNGSFTWNTGELVAQRSIVFGSDEYFDAPGTTLTSGQTLSVAGNATVSSGDVVTVDSGGMFAANAVIHGTLDLQDAWLRTGSASLLGVFVGGQGDITIEDSGTTRALLKLDAGSSIEYQRYLDVGQNAAGRVEQSGGSVSAAVGYKPLLRLGYGAAGDGQYQLNDGSISVVAAQIGYNGNGDFEQNGGSFTIADQSSKGEKGLALGYKAGSTGSYLMTGGSLVTPNIIVGNYGSGDFTMTSGQANFGEIGYLATLQLGVQTGSEGRLNIHGGSVDTTVPYVGYSAFGAVVQSGGQTYAHQGMIFAYNNNSSGDYEISGGSLIVDDPLDGSHNVIIGRLGDARFIQSGGEVSIDMATHLGYYSNSSGLLEVSDGTFTTRQLFLIANAPGTNSGSAAIHLTGGTIHVTQPVSGSTEAFTMGFGSGSAAVNISGGHFQVDGLARIGGVGYSMPTTFVQSGGSTYFAEARLNTHYNFSVGSAVFDKLVIGVGGPTTTPIYTQSSGMTTCDELWIASSDSISTQAPGPYTGVFELSGGTLNANLLVVADDAPNRHGTLNISNGAEVMINDGYLGGKLIGAKGFVNLTGQGSSLTVLNNLYVGAKGYGTLTIGDGSVVSVVNELNIRGNTVDGDVSPGRIVVATGGSLSYGRLTGRGTIEGDLTNVAVVAPGQSPGTLNVEGGFVQVSTGRLEMEFADPAMVGQGLEYDQQFDVLAITDDATLDGTLSLARLDSYVPEAGNAFEIITADTFNGRLKSVEGAIISDDLAFAILYDIDPFGLDSAIVARVSLLGDANVDNVVDIADLVRLSQNYSRNVDVTWTDGDFNQDGAVNIADLVLLSQHYSQSVEVLEAFVAAVRTPAPGTASVVCLVSFILMRRRTRC